MGRNPGALVRPLVRRLRAYVPGEQPKIKGLVKLNTNENPYPPSPKVIEAVKDAVDGRLRLYPNPTSEALRQKLAGVHGCQAANIIVGNGSDELLAMAVRAFVEPAERPNSNKETREAGAASRQTVQYFAPSYSLYPVLADIHGARRRSVPLTADFGIPSVSDLHAKRRWDFRAALTFITTPNAPTGRGYTTVTLDALCQAQGGVVVLDETYVDFANENALELAFRHPHVLVSRTFSKAYSLCFQRVGYCVGHPALIEALDKIKDSYNVNGLGQVAALATLDDLPYYRANFSRIIATREWLTAKLAALGFQVFPSQANFIFVRPPKFAAETWLHRLRELKILVRWFSAPETRDCLRISIGSEPESRALLRAVRKLLAAAK